MPINSTRAIYLPYCVQQLGDKTWVILNRNYKPLGSGTTDYVEYEDIPIAFRIAKITPAQAKKISYKGDADATEIIYLYDDGCVPTYSKKDMAAYLPRLEALMKLKLVGELE